MKKFTTMAMALLLQAVAVSGATVDTLTVRVKGMRCEECFHKVRKAVKALPGIDGLSANLERRTVTVAYDPQLTCADSIRARLAATKRYAATDYSPADVIKRGFGLRIGDMYCQNCADRIVARLEHMVGIDSLAAHVDKHYVFIRYDANQTCKADIRKAVLDLGYTPVNYYSGPKVDYAYYNIPADEACQATLDEVLAIDGVEDVNANPKRKSLAVTFFKEEVAPDVLLEKIRQAGIKAELPKPHECKEQ